MTVAESYRKFLLNRQVYCSNETIATYMCHLKSYFAWLSDAYAPLDVLDFDQIPADRNIFSEYILAMKSGNPDIRNTSIRSYCRTIKTFLRFCYNNDYCRDYLKNVKLPRDDSIPQEVLYQNEVAKLDQCFDRSTVLGARNYCIVHLMLDCGLRSQEVRHLQSDHLRPEKNIILIKDSKGNKSRFTLAPDFVFDALLQYQKLSGITSGVILRDRRMQPMSKNCVKQLFQDLKLSSGITRIHAHLLRHTFATSYLIGGGNMEFLRVFMGHSDYKVIQTYTNMAAQCKMLGADVYHLDPIYFTRGY